MCSNKHCIFMVMVIINVLNAWYYTCFGPVIPFYSDATGQDETHYSYLFFVKTLATVLGGYLAKYLIIRVSTQPLIIGYMILAMISLCASTFSLNTINLGITLFIATCATVGPSLIGFNITLKIFLDDEPQYWVQIYELFFVIGALGGQFFVNFFEIQSFLVLGLGFIIPIIGVIIWPVPDMYDMLTGQQQKGVQLGTRSKVFICIVFFCFATVEMGIGSWIPTYAIKAGIADTKGSTLYSMLFWVPNCVVRLIWIYLPGTIQKKLGIGLNLGLVATIIAVFLQLSNQLQLVCYFAPISIGILISGVYGFCLSWVVNNGFAFNPEDNATFIICYVVGEGLFIMPMGYTMGLFGYKSMIIQVCFFALLAVVAFILAVGAMEEDKNEYQMLAEDEKIIGHAA